MSGEEDKSGLATSGVSVGTSSTDASSGAGGASGGRSTGTTKRRSPGSIDMPAPPELGHDPEPVTNTLALLLPHQAFFAPAALSVLREAFGAYGTLAHWAPVRAMGRVIAVYTDEEAAAAARREADGLKLDVALVDADSNEAAPSGGTGGAGAGDQPATAPAPSTTAGANANANKTSEQNYFTHSRQSSASRSTKGLVLRVFALPPTSLDTEPDHLRPPEQGRNFLISPPGSPPEGWEPIEEDGPNIAPLADDLRRALESLQLQGRGHVTGPEVILDEGGVRVEVEDTTQEDREWGEERIQGPAGTWAPPNQDGGFTPSGRILPTARPPI